MSTPAMQRVFWGWERPVLESAVEFLTAPAAANTTLDLADAVLIVPTAEAGRRLRRALAEWADARGGAVSAPHVWPPHLALTSREDRARTANETELLLAWMRALEQTPAQELRALFPSPPENPGWTWRKNLASTLVELHQTLGAGGLSMADVATANTTMPESERERWHDLARLEKAHTQELSRHGKISPHQAKRQRARQPQLPAGVTRVLVLAAPDLPPLLDTWLQACAQSGIEVTLAIHAPPHLADHFDTCGRPLPAFWGEDADLSLPIPDSAIHQTADPAEQAALLVDLMRQRARQQRPIALAVCDPDVSPLLKEKLEREGLAIFEPGGLPAHQDGLWHLLSLTVQLAADASWSCIANLMRIAEVRQAWVRDTGAQPLRELDDFAATHLPSSLQVAADLLADLPDAWPLTRRTVHAALAWRHRLLHDDMVETAHAWLIALHGERIFNTSDPADDQRAQTASAWLDAVSQVKTAAQSLAPKASPPELWALALERLSTHRLEPARGDIDLVLQGWLELLWEPAPALLIAGMNEEFVPGILGSHPFLPDGLRQQLGLPSQRSRFARDTCLLRTLAETRHATSGSLDLLCARWSRHGEARKPSRLLLLCAQDALPTRVHLLFPKEEPPSAASAPPRSLAWKLQPEWREPSLDTISPSRLKAYLACPFRFYLSHVLNMREVAPPPRELDALAFGNALHEVLSAYGQDENARLLTDEQAIARWLAEALQRWTRQRFGRRPPPLVRLQMDAARQRLQAHAAVEAMERQQGWRIEAVELPLGGEDDATPLLIEGARLRGSVDRLERHHRTGQRRIIDFKTSDKPSSPLEAHSASKNAISPEDEWKRIPIVTGKKNRLWTDLQLPLYAAALRHKFDEPVSQVAYACLTKTLFDVQILEWPEFDQAWEDAALACAAEAVRRIRAGHFWPPNPKARGDFDHLFLGDPAATAQAPAP